MVMESRFWREDIEIYARKFRAVRNPPRWSERLVVTFEKDVTLALFMVRRLAEAGKLSKKFINHRVKISRHAFIGEPHRLRYSDILELYDLQVEHPVAKGAMFLCNQFIHAHATYAFRDKDRNWKTLYTCSDFEMRKWMYKVSITEIVRILELAVQDVPERMEWRYDPKSDDWIREIS